MAVDRLGGVFCCQGLPGRVDDGCPSFWPSGAGAKQDEDSYDDEAKSRHDRIRSV